MVAYVFSEWLQLVFVENPKPYFDDTSERTGSGLVFELTAHTHPAKWLGSVGREVANISRKEESEDVT